jgi:hypothetical protein
MELLKQIQECEKIINQSTDGVKAQFLSSMVMGQNQAKDQLKELKLKYKATLKDSVILMIPVGAESGIKQLSKLLVGKALIVDGEKLYKELAQTSNDTLSDKTKLFSTLHQQHLMSSMHLVAEKLGIRSLPMPKFGEIRKCSNMAETVDFVKEMVRATNKDDLAKMFIEQDILDAAIKDRNTRNPLYVFLTGLNVDERNNLPKQIYSGNHLVVEDIPAEVDFEYAEKLMKNLNKKYRKTDKTV